MKKLLASLLLITPAFAHDNWISRENLTDPVTKEFCCNADDCAAVEEGGIKESLYGHIVVETGEFIQNNRIIWRSPGGWIRCRYLGGPKANMTRCLIGPPRGF